MADHLCPDCGDECNCLCMEEMGYCAGCSDFGDGLGNDYDPDYPDCEDDSADDE